MKTIVPIFQVKSKRKCRDLQSLYIKLILPFQYTFKNHKYSVDLLFQIISRYSISLLFHNVKLSYKKKLYTHIQD